MERFGKFQILELIGRGGMAEIFLAKPSDAVLSKLVALKRILPEYSEDPAFRDMFQKEGKIALAFRHPGIIAVQELGVIDEKCYMSMEYFPGKTLSNLVNQMHSLKVKIQATDVAYIVMKIAEALNYIHDFQDYGGIREIIHRDISPHNIMVGFDGAIKLIDFGIAKDTSHETTHSKTVKGKVAYMSPEQVRGEALTKRTDIFSLGVVFWELLTQKKLFIGNTLGELTQKVKQGHIQPLALHATKGSPELFRICERALAFNPQARYHSAGEMAAELYDYLKRAGGENYQKQLGGFVRGLFPEDVSHLKGILRKHEGTQELPAPSFDTGPQILSSQDIASSPSAVKGMPNFGAEKKEEGSSLTSKMASAMMTAAAVIGFLVYLNRPEGGGKHRSDPPVAEPTAENPAANQAEPEKVVFRPPPPQPATQPVQQPQVQVPAPTPVAAPVVTPNVVPQTPQPTAPVVSNPLPVPAPAAIPAPPKPNPLPVKKNAAVAKKPATQSKTKTAKISSARKPIVTAKPTPSTRTPAAKPAAPTGFAYITVLSAPKSRILVNGKFVGSEVTGEIKVPAGVPVNVQSVISGAGTKSKTLKFKPNSRNVVEMFDGGQ